MRKLSLSSLEADMKASKLCTDVPSFEGMSVNDLAELYETAMSDLPECPVMS